MDRELESFFAMDARESKLQILPIERPLIIDIYH